ncbi:HAD-superfamily hydrolase [Streptococcus criceti]|uniref:Uncharacterized protein n=1 Tax=Streptococcus criceti HS-6 TaxID=873449 RepID=G5JMJ4_STRCG|nr:HAD-IIB family hydrolase [Streptococcus criceti]EHI74726.1 hypothetical protein STRCR_1256 [Streptococcus criceti HS-6]SUN38634.1 HAD-superfamily hydrolase [Streptococcus criceti]
MNFVFDLDGTLSFDGYSIDESIKEVLAQAASYGHKVNFASARSYRDSLDMLGEKLAQERVFGLNGGLVYERGELILEHNLDPVGYQEAIKYCRYFNLPFFVDNCFNYATDNEEYIPFIKMVDPLNLAQKVSADDLKNPIKMVIYLGNHEDLLADITYQAKETDLFELIYHESEKCLYLNPNHISKSSTIREVFDEPYIAFGNDKNDIGMFKDALYAVQVGRYPYLKTYADDQVEADSQAVAAKILELFQEFQGK